jgi:hypothetical protein
MKFVSKRCFEFSKANFLIPTHTRMVIRWRQRATGVLLSVVARKSKIFVITRALLSDDEAGFGRRGLFSGGSERTREVSTSNSTAKEERQRRLSGPREDQSERRKSEALPSSRAFGATTKRAAGRPPCRRERSDRRLGRRGSSSGVFGRAFYREQSPRRLLSQ